MTGYTHTNGSSRKATTVDVPYSTVAPKKHRPHLRETRSVRYSLPSLHKSGARRLTVPPRRAVSIDTEKWNDTSMSLWLWSAMWFLPHIRSHNVSAISAIHSLFSVMWRLSFNLSSFFFTSARNSFVCSDFIDALWTTLSTLRLLPSCYTVSAMCGNCCSKNVNFRTSSRSAVVLP